LSIDLPTIELVLCLVYAGNVLLATLMAWSGRSFPGAWLWVLAQGLLAVSALLMVLRPWVPAWAPAVVGNGLYVGAALPFAHAIWKFRFSQKFPLVLYSLLPLVLFSFSLVATESYEIRSLVYSGWAGAGALFVAGLLVWKVQRPYRTSNILTSLPFFAIGLASGLRLVANLTSVAGIPLGLGAVNGLYMLGAVVVAMVTLFGYFMMTGIRAEQMVSHKDAEIQAQNRQLIDSGRSKDLFFSIISHDLRGPIGGAARYARKHLLGKMSGLEARHAEVETLTSALEKTNEFLEKLLWWSRAQLQDWVPLRVPVDLAKTFEQVFALQHSAAELKEITLEVEPGPYPRPLADPESVQLILGNLVSNAVKFSLPGRTVRLSVRTEERICLVTVADEGVGMDRATVGRLFRIEDKLTTHGTSGERGSGLGLLLSRSLAERNQGEIEILSEPGVGTRATLWLPTESRSSPR